ncbi:major facilitator superfamily transporter [Serratia marcescens]|uniref:Major facilitator superfamily transporter n=1 Tax=Serratia marcescens TaxID=615 RepID=A0A379YR41_SERMA|nr:major facilitator superfamily transporter [Serratia marcescens]
MTAENNLQLNRRILSVVMFTFVCYLTIGLPLAVLPGFVHDHLGYNSVLAGLIISAQYFATLFSRPPRRALRRSAGAEEGGAVRPGVLRRQRPVLRAGVRR